MSQVLEERRYYAQNWRKDVVAMLTGSGELVEQVRYSSYGVPFGLPAGDTDSDGDFDLTDLWAITGSYDVRKDTNLDGVVDISDQVHAGNMAGGGGFVTTGRDALGSPDNANRFGYGAYLRDPAVPQWHVRNRVFRSDIGRWLTRDPAGYVDGLNLYQYAMSMAIRAVDPFGLQSQEYDPSIYPGLPPVRIPSEGEYWRQRTNPPRPEVLADPNKLLEDTQGVLDVIGCFPLLGEPCDLINATLYLQQGDIQNAAISFCCILPFADVVKSSRLAQKVGRVYDSVRTAWKKAPSDGFRRTANTLREKLAMQEAKCGDNGRRIMDVGSMGDPRYKEMEKWEYIHRQEGYPNIVIHYILDPKTGRRLDYKFKEY